MSESEKKARKRTPCFRIEVSGTEEKKDEIFGKFASIRQELTKKNNKPMGNLQVIEALLQKWNEENDTSNTQTKEFQEEPCPSTYIRSKKVDTNQHIFLTAADSFKRLISVVEWHARCCKEKLKPTKMLKKGHVCKTSLKCNDKETPHVFSWSSSPYLPTKDYLVNSRVNHGITCSGILPAVYKRFAQGSGIGVISDENRTSFFNVHSQHIQEEYKYSTDIALLQEIASYEELDSKIDIMSDARHGWRKNAKDTSVVCIGEKTHKVISCEHVTKTMDPVSQRHERLGTEKIFNYLHENDVTVNVHCHDRNLSINKYIRENTEAINQNDVWHCVKSVKSALKKVSTGSKSSEGKTWSFQLSDKVEPVATHMHWAIQNCNQDEKKLQKSLLNILDHYKNIHTDCHESARCKVDAKYEPSRIVITSPVAEKLLLSVILNATVYKYAKDYVLGRDTFYVESFNNVTNIYQNKRIAFGDSQYNARANLSVLHWNENVDRDFTSVSIKQNHRMPRSKKGKKNYKRATYKFRDNIWSRFMKSQVRSLRLHKIASNNKKVMEAFPPEDLAKNLENLKLTNQALPVQHSLGIRWSLDSDTFSFNISTDDRPYSRRGVLSTINSIFDPLGFLAPVVVEGRLIQRQLINSTSDWDQPFLTEYFDTWNRWTSSLQELNQLHIRRTYLSDSFSKTEEKSVHIFCDASEKAIAAVSFVRARNNTGQFELGFLHGKSKVAPVHTIPRLELCSAVLATEIADTIAYQLQLPLKEFKLYTDSKVVLGYINNESRRFYNYVANRVQKIRSITLTKQWQYVSTNNNPADKGTRGIHASEMANSLWIRGPQFLLKDTTDHTENFTLQNPDVDKELRPEVVNFKTEIEFSQHLGTNRFSRFSLWKNLIKAIARLKHVAHSFAGKSSCKGWHICSDSASVKAIDEARKLVLREVQLDTYSDEIECLTTRKPLLKSSSIASLTPFLDKENMLRIGGRIQNSDVPDIEKHPILISGRHHIALLIVRHYHELSHHQGRHITEGSIRSAGFWITRGKSLVSSVISKCVKCRKLRGLPCTQKMAILPPDRLEPGPPFTNVGVDCFGPWEVLARRTRGGHANCKRWAAMFTCLTTRAVHVEVIEELSSSSFIMALKRFTAIRGPVSHFRSDRGTNFVGSIKELGIQAINVEDGRMKEFLRNQGTTWQFNPPHASHMGGVWERVIGITRRILDSLLMEASRNKLTHDMLVTFLAEASAIVNSRPLVPVTTDPENPMPLSPSLLLTQKPQQIINNQQIIDSKDMYNKQWKCVQILADKFWNRWKNEYLQTLQTQRKWTEPQKNISPGDVVLIRDKQSARNDWPIGIVERTYPGSDQLVRTCDVRIMRNGERAVTYTRPVTEIVYLFLDESWGEVQKKKL